MTTVKTKTTNAKANVLEYMNEIEFFEKRPELYSSPEALVKTFENQEETKPLDFFVKLFTDLAGEPVETLDLLPPNIKEFTVRCKRDPRYMEALEQSIEELQAENANLKSITSDTNLLTEGCFFEAFEEKNVDDLMKTAGKAVDSINHCWRLRHKLIRKAGIIQIGPTNDFTNISTFNGHRAWIGICYRSIREACDVSLNTMADMLDIPTEELEVIERCGFMPFEHESQFTDFEDIRLFKKYYTENLAPLLDSEMSLSSDIYFDGIVTMNTDLMADVETKINELEHVLGTPEVVIEMFKDVKSAYEDLFTFIDPFIPL